MSDGRTLIVREGWGWEEGRGGEGAPLQLYLTNTKRHLYCFFFFARFLFFLLFLGSVRSLVSFAVVLLLSRFLAGFRETLVVFPSFLEGFGEDVSSPFLAFPLSSPLLTPPLFAEFSWAVFGELLDASTFSCPFSVLSSVWEVGLGAGSGNESFNDLATRSAKRDLNVYKIPGPAFSKDREGLDILAPSHQGSTKVSGDVPTLPWVRSRVWVGAGLRLHLREGWVDTSPETWIDPPPATYSLWPGILLEYFLSFATKNPSMLCVCG